jgi:transposase-like protein
MPRGKAHSDETRAAVMAALLAGQSVSEVAQEFSVDPSLISRWKKALPLEQLHKVAQQKGHRIEDLTFGYLGSLLKSLTNQADVVGGKEYILKQPASEIAVLHGVMADKAFRLLSALPSGGGTRQRRTARHSNQRLTRKSPRIGSIPTRTNSGGMMPRSSQSVQAGSPERPSHFRSGSNERFRGKAPATMALSAARSSYWSGSFSPSLKNALRDLRSFVRDCSNSISPRKAVENYTAPNGTAIRPSFS